ncbi:dephospho-CoA kinase [Collinsella tanakaei]|uniref:dephospho-CoA kinase n=2 Tax=Collinsella tanakaei TaxID=626935 RepID=UPI002E224C7E|nr:dephospho-CoA kinase [Collinsella tanakaei]
MPSMFTLFLLGNIASGKSSAARYLEQRGALRIDLDELAKSLYVPGSPIVDDIAGTFGRDVLDEDGSIRRDELARRAFDCPEHIRKLDNIVHPALLDRLSSLLLPPYCCSVTTPSHELAVVEVSAPQTFTEAFGLADEIMTIAVPRSQRRDRAALRGMTADEFDHRADCQPDDAWLNEVSDVVIDNTGDLEDLHMQLDRWLSSHGLLQGSVDVHG